ncbi:unnamed protein product [Prorocentrum cordatum]|uniref:Uncharacterized protein n=1 Tax=Prorocentrum cordatum TaxID=2364126 RepID=A0ABN9VFS2_9DINO|nr:unnamed protein product [Polarella glacialis]
MGLGGRLLQGQRRRQAACLRAGGGPSEVSIGGLRTAWWQHRCVVKARAGGPPATAAGRGATSTAPKGVCAGPGMHAVTCAARRALQEQRARGRRGRNRRRPRGLHRASPSAFSTARNVPSGKRPSSTWLPRRAGS